MGQRNPPNHPFPFLYAILPFAKSPGKVLSDTRKPGWVGDALKLE
jgi:hypothetical protein